VFVSLYVQGVFDGQYVVLVSLYVQGVFDGQYVVLVSLYVQGVFDGQYVVLVSLDVQRVFDGQYVVLVSLDVQGDFDAAWWPSVLNALREFNCPQNLCNLAKSYFSERVAFLSTSNIKTERQVTKGCPQGSCCWPGFWNIQYNTLLNLDYTRHTQTIAFADDVIVLTKGKSAFEAENFSNVEMRKIAIWAKNNKIRFNEQKSKVLLISRKKRKDKSKLSIFQNNKELEKVDQ
jgi:hypothetical protein